jgi:hypothetical protein
MLYCGFLYSLFSNSELINNILGTILGGLLLTAILFFFNEYMFPKPNLVGEWNGAITIKKSSVASYINLEVTWKIQLLQKGVEVSGLGEKVKEINSQGDELKYDVTKRVHIEIDGYIERNYLKKSKVSFLIYEDGRVRPSSTTYILNIIDSSTLSGVFISTAANTSGEVVLKRNNG